MVAPVYRSHLDTNAIPDRAARRTISRVRLERGQDGSGLPARLGFLPAAALMLALMVAAAPGAGAQSSCGPIPGTFPVSAGTSLVVQRNATMNGNPVAQGGTGANSVVEIDGTRSTVTQTLPALDPPTFPPNGATADATEADSPFNATTDVFYDQITVAADASVAFTGGGPFHINMLDVGDRATVNLAAGTYFIGTLLLGDDAVVNVTSEPVNLHVGTEIDGAAGITMNSGGTVTGLRVYLHAAATLRLKRQADLTGLVFGPASGDIQLDRDSSLHAALITSAAVRIGKDTAMTYTASDQSAVSAVSTCASVDHFAIGHDGAGIHCFAEPVTVTAADSAGNTLTGYTGTITLDTQSGRGTWTLAAGNGAFNDATADDGVATYTFAASDDGQVALDLSYPEGPSPIDILVTDGAATDDDTEGPLPFSPSGFTVTPNDIGNPPGSINPVPAQTAGTSFNLYLTAFGQTPSDPTCGVIESYDGAKSLKFWSTYGNPATGTVPVTVDGNPIATAEGAAVAQAVAFSQGQAAVGAKYKDAGEIRIEMKDDTVANPDLPNGIRGGTNPFVVKPSHFVLSSIVRTSDGFPNPAAGDETGPIFIRAGADFSVTVTARDAEGDATPNYGQESPAEGVALSSTLVAAGDTNNPSIAFGAGFGAFASGSATGTDFSWGEVGIITLTPSVGDADYLGAGDVSGTASGNVGRFIPFDFAVALNAPQFDTACGTFTYVGQPFVYATAPVLTVTARNRSGGVTQNYTGAWWKITDAKLAADGDKTYAAATGALDLGLVPAPDPVIADTGAGTGTLTFSAGGGIGFVRGAAVAPFDAEISLRLDVVDEDDVTYAGNPAQFGDASPGNGIPFSNGKRMRWGRLAVQNAHGSERLALPLPARAQYFDGTGFVTNGDDNCSGFSAVGELTLSNDIEVNETDGDIAIAGSSTTASVGNDPFAGGDADLGFSAPGAGETGFADVSVNLAPGAANLPWLRFDWDGDGNHDDNPSARATFGVFQGSDVLIHVREPWN